MSNKRRAARRSKGVNVFDNYAWGIIIIDGSIFLCIELFAQPSHMTMLCSSLANLPQAFD